MSRSFPPIARRSAAVLVAVLVLPMILAVHAGPARAQGLQNNLGVTDGTVYAETISGNTLYVGGDFHDVGPASGGWAQVDSVGNLVSPVPMIQGYVYCSVADGQGGWFVGGDFNGALGQSRGNLAHFDAAGNLYPWNPGTSGPVNAMLLFAGRLYIGGAFSTVHGQPRNALAVVDTASGNVGTWQPDIDGVVNAITPFGSTFLVGGNFQHVDAFTRHNFAGIDTTGAVWSLDPEPNGAVFAIGFVHRITPNTVTVYLGGQFTVAGGQARSYLAAIDATTGSGTFGQATVFNPGADGFVYSLLVTGGSVSPTIYVGGNFLHIGGQARNDLAALTGAGTATSLDLGLDNSGDVRAIALRGTTLFLGGGFHSIHGVTRHYAGAVDTGTGNLLSWNPEPNFPVSTLSIGAQSTALGGVMSIMNTLPRNDLAAFDLTTGTATAWNPNVDGPVVALHIADGQLYAGGLFSHVGGLFRSNLAPIDLATAEPGPWAASPDGPVLCIDSRPTGAGKSMIYFGGNFTTVSALPRGGAAAVSDDPAATGPDAWAPSINGGVGALAVSGNTIYVGGAFSQAGNGGFPRSNIAALDTLGNATAWNPGATGSVAALAVSGPLVYAAGSFTFMGGQPHTRLAAIDAASGVVQDWLASVDQPVYAMAVAPGAIYVGGLFDSSGTSPRMNLAALDPSTGAALDWTPALYNPMYFNAGSPIRALVEHNGTVYVGGTFAGMLGLPHCNLAGITVATTGVGPGPLAASPGAAIRAFPNPSRGGVAFGLNVPRASTLAVDVYAVDGRLVRALRPSFASAGEQRVDWDGRDAAGRTVPAGVYLVRARSGAWEADGRVVRLR